MSGGSIAIRPRISCARPGVTIRERRIPMHGSASVLVLVALTVTVGACFVVSHNAESQPGRLRASAALPAQG